MDIGIKKLSLWLFFLVTICKSIPHPININHLVVSKTDQLFLPKLRFNANAQFKIVQFTDLHYGEGESTGWGPDQDKNSTRVMETILSVESPVDLVVFTGDLITGNNIENNSTVYWQRAIQVVVDREIPWIIAFGNHDDLASGTGGTRLDLINFDIEQGSYSQIGPSYISGVSNYFINIFDQNDDNEEEIVRLWVLDSGDSCVSPFNNYFGYECNSYITEEQVEWYVESSKQLSRVWSMAFFHIPLQEQMLLWNNYTCYGWNNDSVACQPINAGFFSAAQTIGDIKVMSVGHNHGNDYCGQLDGIELCFGRHSGYGGYGTWERGARVFQITKSSDSNQIDYQTWIRFETTDIVHNQQTHLPNFTNPQTQCTM